MRSALLLVLIGVSCATQPSIVRCECGCPDLPTCTPGVSGACVLRLHPQPSGTLQIGRGIVEPIPNPIPIPDGGWPWDLNYILLSSDGVLVDPGGAP